MRQKKIDAIVICSGWGVAASALKPFVDRLIERFQDQFSKAPEVVYVSPVDDDCVWQSKLAHINLSNSLAIGYSMGLSCLVQYSQVWAGVVSLAGFTWFCAEDKHTPGIAKRVLQRMIDQFDMNSSMVLDQFLSNAKIPRSAALLLDDLKLQKATHDALTRLSQVSIHELWQGLIHNQVPCLILASRDDEIVAPSLTFACFGDKVEWLEMDQTAADGVIGHGLPFNASEVCASRICQWFDSVKDNSHDSK